jgi:CheY-like chemotaxis protein
MLSAVRDFGLSKLTILRIDIMSPLPNLKAPYRATLPKTKRSGRVCQSRSRGPFVRSILIVEDEVLTSEYLEFMLEEAGYEVIPAASADEAIAVLEHRDDVDLIVTDINLPGGLNGLQLAALVRRRWAAIKIIVVTGYSPPGSGEIPTGSLFVPKPYSAQKMIEAVRHFQ